MTPSTLWWWLGVTGIFTTFVFPFTSSPTWPQPMQFTQPHPSFSVGIPRVSCAISSAAEERCSSSCGHVERIQQCWVCRGGISGLCSLPSKGAHRAQANSNLCESAPTLPACPLHESFEPIDTGTPITTTSYLQENKPVRKVVQDTEQTSTGTKGSTLPGKPFNPGFWGLTFETEKMNWQGL